MRLLFLAALAALGSAENLKIGYGQGNGDLQFDLVTGTKYSTRVYALTVPSWSLFNGASSAASTNWFLSIRAYVNTLTDCPNCASQTIDLHYRVGGTTASAADTAVLTKVGGLAMTTSGLWADIPIPSIMTGETQVAFFINITCTACSKSAELSRLEAIVRNVDKAIPATPVVVYGSFDRDNDRNTDYFQGPVGTWGPVVRMTGIVATDYVIIVQDIAALSSGSGIVHYLSTNQTGFATGVATYDATVATCAVLGGSGNGCTTAPVFVVAAGNTGFNRAPGSSYSSGEFPNEPRQIGAQATGTWYVAPLIIRRAAGASQPQFRFAIGLNAVPAAAAGLVPSFIVVAVATLFAALRV